MINKRFSIFLIIFLLVISSGVSALSLKDVGKTGIFGFFGSLFNSFFGSVSTSYSWRSFSSSDNCVNLCKSVNMVCSDTACGGSYGSYKYSDLNYQTLLSRYVRCVGYYAGARSSKCCCGVSTTTTTMPTSMPNCPGQCYSYYPSLSSWTCTGNICNYDFTILGTNYYCPSEGSICGKYQSNVTCGASNSECLSRCSQFGCGTTTTTITSSQLGALTVFVTDCSNSQPINWANVTLSGPQSISGVTNSGGLVNFTLKPGSYSIFVAKPLYYLRSTTGYVYPNQITNVNVCLNKTPTTTTTLGTIGVTCSSCTATSCTCSVSNCQTGSALIYGNYSCGGSVKYISEFLNGNFTWNPGANGKYSLKILCDNMVASSCINVDVGAPSGALFVGQSTTYEGKTITLNNVNSQGSVSLTINSILTVTGGGSYNGIQINVTQYHYSEYLDQRWAVLVFSPEYC